MPGDNEIHNPLPQPVKSANGKIVFDHKESGKTNSVDDFDIEIKDNDYFDIQ